jgi:hypothetical protein
MKLATQSDHLQQALAEVRRHQEYTKAKAYELKEHFESERAAKRKMIRKRGGKVPYSALVLLVKCPSNTMSIVWAASHVRGKGEARRSYSNHLRKGRVSLAYNMETLMKRAADYEKALVSQAEHEATCLRYDWKALREEEKLLTRLQRERVASYEPIRHRINEGNEQEKLTPFVPSPMEPLPSQP